MRELYRNKVNCSTSYCKEDEHFRNDWLNVLHLSDPSTTLASTMCRFLARYAIARFYLLRRLSIEVNVDYIKLLKNMEKSIVPEILNQPFQQHHLSSILVTITVRRPGKKNTGWLLERNKAQQ